MAGSGEAKNTTVPKLMFLAMATPLLIPKLMIGSIAILPIEVVFFAYILKGSNSFAPKKNFAFTNIYFILMALFIIQCLYPILYSESIDYQSLMKSTRYAFYGAFFEMGRSNFAYFSANRLSRILAINSYSIIAIGLFVVIYKYLFPIPPYVEAWTYSPLYRLVGLTGQAISLTGEYKLLGPSSVQVGVYIALIFSLNLSLLLHTKLIRYAIFSITLTPCILLTHSRSGIVVYAVSCLFGILFFILSPNTFLISAIVSIILITTAISFGFNLISLPISADEYKSIFTIFEKLKFLSDGGVDPSTMGRLRAWDEALTALLHYPFKAIFGFSNHNDVIKATFNRIQFESLFVDTTIRLGIVGTFLLLLFYFSLFSSLIAKYRDDNIDYFKSLIFGFIIFLPGHFLANSFGGNSLHTDFIAPVFFMFIGVLLAERRKPFTQLRPEASNISSYNEKVFSEQV